MNVDTTNSTTSTPPTETEHYIDPSAARTIKWLDVVRRQDWGTWIGAALVVIPLIILTSITKDPAQRTFYLYDATISNSYKGDSTVPFWAAGVVPYLMCLISYFGGEIVCHRLYHLTLTGAVASFLHFGLDTIVAGIVNSLITEATKLLVGRHRPDWLDRCTPNYDPTEVPIGPFGQPATSNPVCDTTLSSSKIRDGQMSFISGHSSTAFALSIYSSIYCLWACYYRSTRVYSSSFNHGVGTAFKHRLANDIAALLVLAWVLWQVSLAWGIAISRVMDNKHHPSDVVGGAFMGTVIGAIFAVRAIPRHYRVMDEPVTQQQQQPLLGRGTA